MYFTICARNYLAYALTLRESLIVAEPDAEFLIFLADDAVDDPRIAPLTVPMSRVDIPFLEEMRFRYDLMELSTAIKPFCIEYIFDTLGAPQAIYLDPDIYVFRPLEAVKEALDAGASAVLTPHILAPLADDRHPSDLDILTSGTFNLGFAAFANCPEARDFVRWWACQLEHSCRVDLAAGLFVDQKFVDMGPSFLSQLYILRDPGYNVAYWNLAHRPISKSGDEWHAADYPLVFFHFSGVVPGNPAVFSKHQNRFDIDSAGAAAVLVRDYLGRLETNNHARWSKIPYAHACFTDGTRIPAPVRRRALPFGGAEQAFSAYDANYWNAPSPIVDQAPCARITRLMVAIHAARPDLQDIFPLSSSYGRRGYCDWFVLYAAREYKLPEIMMPKQTERLATRAPDWLRRGLAKVRLARRI